MKKYSVEILLQGSGRREDDVSLKTTVEAIDSEAALQLGKEKLKLLHPKANHAAAWSWSVTLDEIDS